MTKDEFETLPIEEQQAAVVGTRTQMILELIVASRLPLDVLTLAAMQMGMERIAAALEKVVADTPPADRPTELFLASTMTDAVRGGSKKVIFDGKG